MGFWHISSCLRSEMSEKLKEKVKRNVGAHRRGDIKRRKRQIKKNKDERGRRKRKGSWCFKEGLGFGFILKLFSSSTRATKSQWSEQALCKALALLLTALHHMQSPTEVKSAKVLYNYEIRMVRLCTPYVFMLQKRVTHSTGKWNMNLP